VLGHRYVSISMLEKELGQYEYQKSFIHLEKLQYISKRSNIRVRKNRRDELKIYDEKVKGGPFFTLKEHK
jgi:hypothetical protein